MIEMTSSIIEVRPILWMGHGIKVLRRGENRLATKKRLIDS